MSKAVMLLVISVALFSQTKTSLSVDVGYPLEFTKAFDKDIKTNQSEYRLEGLEASSHFKSELKYGIEYGLSETTGLGLTFAYLYHYYQVNGTYRQPDKFEGSQDYEKIGHYNQLQLGIDVIQYFQTWEVLAGLQYVLYADFNPTTFTSLTNDDLNAVNGFSAHVKFSYPIVISENIQVKPFLGYKFYFNRLFQHQANGHSTDVYAGSSQLSFGIGLSYQLF